MFFFRFRKEARDFSRNSEAYKVVDTSAIKYNGEKHPTRRWAVRVL